MKHFLFCIVTVFCALSMSAQRVITMELDKGVYRVPCTLNGLKMKFIFDTGASSVREVPVGK